MTLGTLYPATRRVDADKAGSGQRRRSTQLLQDSPSSSAGYGASDFSFYRMENDREGMYF